MPGNALEGRVTKKGYNRICSWVHLYALICSCNLLKSKTGRRMTTAFHAVDRGSNPLGDAKIRCNEGYQCIKRIGILYFFVSTRSPVVHIYPVVSNSCRGIFEGRSPNTLKNNKTIFFCPEMYRNIPQRPRAYRLRIRGRQSHKYSDATVFSFLFLPAAAHSGTWSPL